MNKTVTITIIFFIVLSSKGYCQEDNGLNEVIRSRKSYAIDEALRQLEDVRDKKLRELLKTDIDYQLKGTVVELDSIIMDDFQGENGYVAEYLLAYNIGLQEIGKDKLVFSLYSSSYQKAKEKQDTLVMNEVLRRLIWHLFRNSNELDAFDKYLNEFKKYAQDSVDLFYIRYYDIAKRMIEIDENQAENDSSWVEEKFKEGYQYAPSSFFRGLLQQMHGIYYSAYLNEQDLGLEYYEKAIANYSKETFYYAKSGIAKLKFNAAIIDYERGRYDKAIPIFLNDLKKQKNALYRVYSYDWLYKCYDKLGRHDSAYYYFKRMVEAKNKLDRLKHAREIKRIESEYDLTAKEVELTALSQEKKWFQTSFYTLVPILGLVLVILGLIFLLYKKYYKKSSNLEAEKSETLQKLDELKRIVVKNHVILKDKTKIYISDLMYVKADDHYLNLFLSNGKNHFVRGKLKNIKEELPPNFIQCHRSYIVNSNFVKQISKDSLVMINKERIPLSRSFKDKFR